MKLQGSVIIVGEVVGQELRESRSLDELHERQLYAICVCSPNGCWIWGRRFKKPQAEGTSFWKPQCISPLSKAMRF
jgi:hypothetical protein